MKITEIKKIGKGDRYYLYVDDECLGVMEAEVLARHSLKTGQEFDKNFFDELILENGDYACFNRALGLLAKLMKTEKQLRDYLKEKKYPKVCIDKAIEKLKEYGYINDEAYAENYINLSSASKSRRKIKYELLSKGVKEEIIENALESFTDENEYDVCLKFAEKYLKNKQIDLKTKQKFYSHLAGKGFGFSDIARAWEEVTNDRD